MLSKGNPKLGISDTQFTGILIPLTDFPKKPMVKQTAIKSALKGARRRIPILTCCDGNCQPEDVHVIGAGC